MKLLENVRGAKTSDLTIATMMAWGKRIGKWCILVGNCPGFVGNRMVGFYSAAARAMLERGMLPEEVRNVQVTGRLAPTHPYPEELALFCWDLGLELSRARD